MSLVLFDGLLRLAGLGCREAPDSASLLAKPAKRVFFAYQKRALHAEFAHFATRSYANTKSKQKKGDPAVCVPSLRCGQPAVLGPAGVPLELAALRQSRALIRLALRSSAQTEGTFAVGFGVIASANPNPQAPFWLGL
jgi:hypothetical protein